MPGEYDMDQMREEAVRRAREMQARAHLPPRQTRQGRNTPQHREQPPAPEPEKAPQPELVQEPLLSSPAEELSPSSAGLLENLFQDKERTIILALLILLSGEESNHELMFALMFLLI